MLCSMLWSPCPKLCIGVIPTAENTSRVVIHVRVMKWKTSAI